MDVINLSGIWTSFPKIAGHGRAYVGRIYREMMEEERYKRRILNRDPSKETARQTRLRLLGEIEKRIMREDQDDLFTVLAA